MTSLQETQLSTHLILKAFFFFNLQLIIFNAFKNTKHFLQSMNALKGNIGHSGEVYVIIKLFNQRATGAWHN